MYTKNQIDNFKIIEFEAREKKLINARPQELKLKDSNKEKLHITYVMTWTGVCGGTKIILEHSNRLTERGHKITLISHDSRPDWFNLNSKIEFIQVPWGEILGARIPKCDLIVATYWREMYECVEQKIAPVVYFEQGDFHLFDLEKLDERTYNYIKKQFETVKFVYTVSSFAKRKIKELYNKEAIVIPNAVDDRIFFPNENKDKNLENNEEINIALIGDGNSKFKKIGNILDAIKTVQSEGYNTKVNWISPTEQERTDFKAIVNPPQMIIGNTLRKSDIYICASMYESFCLPVLEAMTCGAAVITTNNGGNMDFVEENKNALLIEKDNVNDIAEKIKILINNPELRKKISNNGIETSRLFNWEKIIDKIEEYYKEVAKYSVSGGI